MPSPVRSATATARGLRPTAKVCWTLKVPSPLPRSTLTVLPSELAVTMSGRPSPFKSATATDVGAGPTEHGLPRPEGAVAVAELHGHRVLAATLVVTTSRLPSPVRSATAAE